jgi:diadenosine tetraphosphatase ApaH/serine/threonine PP2A family protein phosphatase
MDVRRKVLQNVFAYRCLKYGTRMTKPPYDNILREYDHSLINSPESPARQQSPQYAFSDSFLFAKIWKRYCVWRHCVQCFDCFGLAALIDEQVLCAHGGLSPDVRTPYQVRAIDRNQAIPHEGAFCDLVWSDPEDVSGSWQLSPRGVGYLFGK